jgi:hypothetical protein
MLRLLLQLQDLSLVTLVGLLKPNQFLPLDSHHLQPRLILQPPLQTQHIPLLIHTQQSIPPHPIHPTPRLQLETRPHHRRLNLSHVLAPIQLPSHG